MKRLLLLLVILPFFINAQSPNLTLTPVITGLNRPVYVTHCNDNRIFVVEQAGRIKVFDSAYNYLGIYLNVSNIVSQPTSQGDERGLLGLAFHPDYANNGYFYINYTRTVNGQLKTFITRYSVSGNNPNKADSLSAFEILSFNQPYSNHNGGCINFGPDGYLYIGTGDGGSANDPQGNGQKLNTYLAKMLRIDVDGGTPYSIPLDNPFIGVANAYPEIWAYGLRNPWRFSFDRLNGNLWIADVGQNLYEEVNVHYNGDSSGENYGWRCFEGMHSTGLGSGTTGITCPSYDNTHKPIYEYIHTGGECSITGGYVYRGALHNVLFGNYLCADYCSGKIRRLIDNGNGTYTPEIIYTGDYTVSFGEDRWGELYVCSSSQNAVLKISDGNCQPVAYVTNGNNAAICAGQSAVLKALYNPALSYQWYQDGSPINNANSAVYEATQTGVYYVVTTNANGCSTASANVVVVDAPLPDVQINDYAPVCPNDDTLVLAGSPAGGVFSGPGVSGNQFNPAVGPGQYQVSYTYTAPNGCSNTATTTIDVLTLPVLNFIGLPDTVCGDMIEDYMTLQAEPSGGTFSGPTVNGNVLTLNQFNNNFTVTYSYTQPDGCSNEITAQVFFALCSGISPTEKSSGILLYPNPANDRIQVLCNGTIAQTTLQIFNLAGLELVHTTLKSATTIDTSTWPSGIYFYQVINESGVRSGKLEIVR